MTFNRLVTLNSVRSLEEFHLKTPPSDVPFEIFKYRSALIGRKHLESEPPVALPLKLTIEKEEGAGSTLFVFTLKTFSVKNLGSATFEATIKIKMGTETPTWQILKKNSDLRKVVLDEKKQLLKYKYIVISIFLTFQNKSQCR